MLDKEELKQYFGQYCLTGDIQELYFDCSKKAMSEPFINKVWRPTPDHVLGLRSFEEYDAAIEYIKEFGRLIDLYINDYCKDDQKKLDDLYQFYERSLISGVFFEIRSLMLESPDAVKHFRKYFEEGYDYMYDNTRGWSSWNSDPCYCKRHSRQYLCIEYSEQRVKQKREEPISVSQALWSAASGVLGQLIASVGEIDKLPMTELKITETLYLFSSDQKIKETLRECDPFMGLLNRYLDELRSNVEITVDNVELGREIFNSHIGEKCNIYIDTPIDFIERISKQELVKPLLDNSECVPCYLAKIHNVIYAERI